MTGFKYLLVIIGDYVIYTNNFFAYVNFPQRVTILHKLDWTDMTKSSFSK